MPTVVELNGVTKNFGYIKALKGINFDLLNGEKISLLGPNGAGKSTLIKIISTQMSPSTGSVRLFGQDALKNREEVKKRIGFVGHKSFLYDELTVIENLEFYGAFMDLNGDEYDYVLKLTGLEKWRNVKASHLSFGLRKRGDISRAMLGKPELLLLDEFFSGLDIETSEVLVQHLKKMNHQSMIISSHSPEYIHSLCDRAVYLRGGLVEKEEWLHNEEK